MPLFPFRQSRGPAVSSSIQAFNAYFRRFAPARAQRRSVASSTMSATDDAAKARENAMAAVRAIFERYMKLAEKGPYRNGEPDLYDFDCMNRAELLDAGPEGSVLFRIKVTKQYSNLNNVMHGGAAGVFFDMFTMTALGPIARPGYWDFMGGITRALNITFLRGVPIDASVYFRSRVVQHGKNMALIRGEMTSHAPEVGDPAPMPKARDEYERLGQAALAPGRGVPLSRDGANDVSEYNGGVGVVYATCEHHKVNIATGKEHMGVRIPWDDEMEKIGYKPKL